MNLLHDIFISYSSEDRARIKPLVDALVQRGWRVWWDRTILAGRIWEREIEAALAASRCVIVAWSHTSVESDWVWSEANEGNKRKILVPVMLDAVKVPMAFGRVHAANLVGWPGEQGNDQFDEVARAVAGLLGNTMPAATEAAPTAGTVRRNTKDGLNYVWIPPGSFTMGCSEGDTQCYKDEKPTHRVTITKGFWLGQTVVTAEAWKRYRLAANKPALPSETRRLSKKELGRPPCRAIFILKGTNV